LARVGVVKSVRPGTGTEEAASVVAEANAGQETPFEAFFEQAWPDAVRLAGLLTQDRGAAEELAQEAFTQMYRTWGRAAKPEAYFRRTLVNICHNWRRRARVRQAKMPLVATTASIEFTADELADAVASLPFRQRAVSRGALIWRRSASAFARRPTRPRGQ
jgi:DNA-directed RNA polymerase specialized sigma24 family protein